MNTNKTGDGRRGVTRWSFLRLLAIGAGALVTAPFIKARAEDEPTHAPNDRPIRAQFPPLRCRLCGKPQEWVRLAPRKSHGVVADCGLSLVCPDRCDVDMAFYKEMA